MTKDFFLSMSSNIGSLVLFLNNPKNSLYLNYLNENIPEEIKIRSISERIYYFLNDIKVILNCDCGDHLSFIGFKNGYRKTCGKKECFISSRKKTCVEKYGVDNPKKSKEIIEREKENILKKWDGKHYLFDESIRNKYKNTMLDRYGVEWAQQNEEISKKSKESWDKNPEKDLIIEKRANKIKSKSKEEKEIINSKKKKSLSEKFGSLDNFIGYRLEKIREKSLEKWGVDHHFKSKDIIDLRISSYLNTITEKIIERLPSHIKYLDRQYNKNVTDLYLKLNCDNCNNDFEITRQLIYLKCDSDIDPCPICNPKTHGVSKMVQEVLEFIKENYNGDIQKNTNSLISKEIDIYLPEFKQSFEFNGLYWHSDIYKSRKFHLEKTLECKEIGINLFHIWEDDWLYRKNILKSMILNKIGKISNRIFARNCEIKVLTDNKLIRDFLEKNHLQGFVGSSIKLGLFSNNELVSIMTFGGLRKSLGQKSTDGSFELLRFCNKINYNVVGGASKLMKYFIKNYSPCNIISYSDFSRSDGNLYKKLGFELSHLSEPNYYYIINGVRNHRFNFRKDKLVKEGFDKNKTEVQIMRERKIMRIFDCGMEKWILEV